MFDKAPTRALIIVMIAAGMLSGCASIGDLQQHHQVERILQQKKEPVGIVFPIRLDFDEADNMTTLAVQKELIKTLESDDQVTVVGFELGQILCETLDGAEDASVLDFAISPMEILRAARVSYNVFGGEAFTDGVTRKVWRGKDTEKNADGTYRTVSLSWTTECNAETFLQTVTTHGPNGSLSVVKSIPCDAGSSIDICIVEIGLDLRESGEPLIPVSTSKDNTEDSDNTRRHLGAQTLREGGKDRKNAGHKRNLQSSTPEIDMLIIYSQIALKALGDISTSQMETMLAAEIEEANDIMANSEIDLMFKLVHVQEWTHDFVSNDDNNIIKTFQANEDVADLRSQYQADVVMLIGPLNDNCGLAYLYAGLFAFGYSVTSPICLSWKTVTHELGHNLGCYHDRDSSSTQHDYAHGLRYCTGDPKIQTIMAYTCNGVDIPYFSNPAISYSGLPTGIEADIDCARRIRETMVSVSEYSDASICKDNGGLATSLGNGLCDSINNKKECLWDKGDCCKSCCSHTLCGMAGGYDCKDPKCGGDAPTPAPTPPPPSNSASGRIETTLLVEGLLYFAAVSIQLCLLSQF